MRKAEHPRLEKKWVNQSRRRKPKVDPPDHSVAGTVQVSAAGKQRIVAVPFPALSSDWQAFMARGVYLVLT